MTIAARMKVVVTTVAGRRPRNHGFELRDFGPDEFMACKRRKKKA